MQALLHDVLSDNLSYHFSLPLVEPPFKLFGVAIGRPPLTLKTSTLLHELTVLTSSVISPQPP